MSLMVKLIIFISHLTDDVSYLKLRKDRLFLPHRWNSFMLFRLYSLGCRGFCVTLILTKDTVRLDFINSANVQDMIKKYGKK